MPTERPACSEAQSAAGNRRVEAAWSKPASRSEKSRTRDGLVTHKRTASLPDMLKPVIRCEETFKSSVGVLRGREGPRAGKVGFGRRGDPGRWLRENRGKERSEEISCVLAVGESERPVVASERGNARGAKGPWHERSGLRKERS